MEHQIVILIMKIQSKIYIYIITYDKSNSDFSY